MVLLSMTPTIVAAVQAFNSCPWRKEEDGEPSLEHPSVGNPISHRQLIHISKCLKSTPEKTVAAERCVPVHLSELLKGCSVYIPPAPPKPEKSDEYKALMARLRKEEEARKYSQMLNPAPLVETFSQRFPDPAHGALFPPQPSISSSGEEDEITYADINRHLALIANVLVSIIACAVCVWKAAWHWNVPERLALSMVSSIVVAVAEVAIYAGYLGRLEEARAKERRKVERRSVAESWVIQPKAREGRSGTAPGEESTSELRMRGTKKKA
ncbi:uncharacterized protein PV09_03494 [Verruconis gallopava]|uniref:Uncharacterized protein n=1 Tax=Verruconis gallopava TaxID=253628 RepID=A0A0D2AF82_9PEZI|nr:uncharacterized protein PV09_03494 [Verruconis gallopava]KIW05623.1 hypothetical protein PV09_03494 [Verruconis gallopava]